MFGMVFMQILNMSLTADIVILVVYLVRLLLWKAPKVISYALWAVVLFRLLCPVSFTSEFSFIPDRIGSGEIVSGWADDYVGESFILHDNSTYYDAAVAAGREPIPAGEEGYYVVTGGDRLAEPETIESAVIPVLSGIWLAGVIGMFLYGILTYFKLKRRLIGFIPFGDNIFLSDYINSPFVMGVFRPKIFLPSTLSEAEQKYIILHEKHHIKRWDPVIKALSFLALCIHWFNPLVWFAFVLSGKDMEMSCDEAVVRKLGTEVRADYSESLLRLATGRRIIAGMPLAFGEGDTKGRIRNLMNWKKPVTWVVVVLSVICVVIGVGLATNPKEESLYAPNPFCHSYRVESLVYAAPQYSFSVTPANAPLFSLTSDYVLFTTVIPQLSAEEVSADTWVSCGGAEEIKLNDDNFDKYLSNNIKGGYGDIISASAIRRNNEKAWRVIVENDPNNVFYYILQQKNGEVYISYGYYNPHLDDGSIRWLFRLARIDLLTCNAVSDGMSAFIEPSYYQKGFDFDYNVVTGGEFQGSGSLVFDVDWETDTLVVGEDYYEDTGNAVVVQKETYELQQNSEGKFELNIAHRNPSREESAVYFIQGEVGTYVMKINFVVEGFAESITEMQDDSEDMQESPGIGSTSLDTAVTAAILGRETPEEPDGLIRVESHKILATEVSGPADDDSVDTVTVYAHILYEAYSPYSNWENGFISERGSYIPTVLTFSVELDGTYTLKEYWIPRDGSYYPEDIRSKFPEAVVEEALNNQHYIDELILECQNKAMAIMNERDPIDDEISGLLDVISSSATASSQPEDYIEAHPKEYNTLIGYGKYTLRYCFGQFLQGGQTDLRGHIMAKVCEEITGRWREEWLTDKPAFSTGQDRFDEFREHAEMLAEQYDDDTLQKYYPVSWLLLQMIKE